MEGEELQEKGRSKAKGLLSFLLGGRQGARPEEVSAPPSEEIPPEIPAAAPADGAQPLDDSFEAAQEGALCQLWRAWAPDTLPPRFSLGLGEGGAPLSAEAVERTKAEVAAALERDARARLQELSLLERRTQPEEGAGADKALPAKCGVYVSRDGMAAWGFLFPPVGDGKLEVDAFGKALQASRVSAGIDAGAIADLFGQRRYFELRLVARGVPAVDGVDGRIVERYPHQAPRNIRMNEVGQVDYRSQSYVQSVRRGDVLCDVIPPQPGTDGLRVDGRVIASRTAKEARLTMGSNTALSEDKLHLIATMDGHLEYAGSAIQIKSTLEIPGDVDYATGNIDFHGDVHIRGDVRENFTVRATGTITVDGLVEAATVEAGGDIVVANGVLGDNKALLKGRGAVRARYLESCVVYSGGCTFADCIMASRVYSDDRVCVTGGKGIIVGGSITAAHGVEARVIGSKAGRETAVTLGVLPYVQEERRSNGAELGQIQRERSELDRELAYLESHQGEADGAARLAKARLRRSVLALKQDKLLRRQRELEGVELDLAQCRLECGTVYPRLKLRIGAQTRELDEIWTGCTAVYDTECDEIKFV